MTSLIVLLISISLTNLSITLYLHRVVCHRALKLHPYITSFLRFWLWMNTTIRIKEWVAGHRYHHHTSDTEKDPHSPLNTGFWSMFFYGAIYHNNKKNNGDFNNIIRLYSKDIKVSKLEEFYNRHPYLGKVILLVALAPLCGIWTIVVWLLSINWSNFVEQRLQPAFTHYYGYRNFNTKENSTNMLPWAFIMFGEELHNNHHANPSNWSFRAKWFEIDPAAVIAQILIWLRLAYPEKEIRKTINLF